jgi:uncharacterized membrane protein YphA (DoxX/SURF4 family)
MAALRLAARLLLAWVFVRNGLDVLRNPEPRVTAAAWLLEQLHTLAPFLLADHALLVRANATGSGSQPVHRQPGWRARKPR